MNNTICTRCKQPRLPTEMATRAHKDGRQTRRGHCKYCKAIQTQASARKKNFYKDRIRNWRNMAYSENMNHIVKYLQHHPCVDCGLADIIVLEFDHIRGEKSFTISSGIWQHRLPKIIAEIGKCDIRCSNCHRRKTLKENNQLQWFVNKTRPTYALKRSNINMPLLMEYLEHHPCVDCGCSDPLVLEFDHKEDKHFNIKCKSKYAIEWKTFVAEIAKCEIRCCNCHRRRTYLTNKTVHNHRITY